MRMFLAIAIMLIGIGGIVAGANLGAVARLDDLPTPGAVDAAPPVEPPRVPKVTLSYQPGPGAEPIGPTEPVVVRATNGSLRDVALTTGDGTRIEGQLAPDQQSWTATGPLAFGTSYTWTGTAVDADGLSVPLDGSVTTVSPAAQVRGSFNLSDGRTVGIAAPIMLQFDAHVSDRAAVERALSVQTSVPTEGAWGWVPDEAGGSRVIWRPREYWTPYTEVTVKADLFGVPYGDGGYGTENITLNLSIGRSQVTEADVQSHQLVVLRDGAEVARYDASYGLDSDPNRNTRSGIHVITEKFTNKRMVNERYGYDVMEKWAVRMSNNGEFIHANPATTGVQGSSNVSHGCVNLSTTNAKEYYDSAMYGDPVEVTGSKVKLSAKDGDVWVWTLDWPQWQALSALDGEATGTASTGTTPPYGTTPEYGTTAPYGTTPEQATPYGTTPQQATPYGSTPYGSTPEETATPPDATTSTGTEPEGTTSPEAASAPSGG